MADKNGNKTGGRSKGTPNKTTRLVKEVFASVFNDLQEDKEANLKTWAKENPTEFYKLSSKLIPVQIAGDPENPIGVHVMSDEEVKARAKEILTRYGKQ